MRISLNTFECAQKHSIAQKLERQIQDFLAKGGVIDTRQNNEKYAKPKLVHGTRHAYNIAACRCAVCVSWYQLKASKTKARRAA